MALLKTDADAKPTGIKKEVKDVKEDVEGVKESVEGVKKSMDERLAEVERKMGVLTRNHDTAVECFDTRTHQLLTWAQEITKAAQEDAEASGEASGLKDPEDLDGDAEPELKLARTESSVVAKPKVAETAKMPPPTTKVDLGAAVAAAEKKK